MIKLDIQDYCHNCPIFEPECVKYYADNKCTMTLVSCTRKGICANIKQYIEEQIARNERPDFMTTCFNKWEGTAYGQSGKKTST